MSLTIAIIGRPNVGKSTLFNRLTGKRSAMVFDTPGVTRDRRKEIGTIGDLDFTLIDTAGLEESDEETLQAAMMAQTELAIEEADIVLMMVDAQAGLLPLDTYFAHWVRKKETPTLLLVNKAEGKFTTAQASEFYELGLSDPIPISAEHNEGMAELFTAIHLLAKEHDFSTEPPIEEEKEPPLRITILGRPNAGKSTLINRLLGEERVVTGPEPGITREAISIEHHFEEKPILLVDTAGIRRKARLSEQLEKMSVGDSIRSMKYANVVILMLDASIPLEKQDLTLAELIIKEGRCLIIGLNKWDNIKNKKEVMENVNDTLERSLPQVRGVPTIPLSALEGENIDTLMHAVFDAYHLWNKRISTGKLNQWLEKATEEHIPPLSGNKRIRLRYITQSSRRPPTFAIFTSSKVKDLPESYTRYLINSLRKTFGFKGVPIRIHIRKTKNPYASS